MIKYIVGNLFESTADAIVNTVNTDGIMDKGIALQFRKLFPSNFKVYKELCKKGDFEIGNLIVVKDQNIETGEKTVIIFPTKTNWRKPSEYEFIISGLQKLNRVIQENNIKSIAIPPLGSGSGGLQWHKVKSLIEQHLGNIENCEIFVYEPDNQDKEVLKKERVKLTPAGGMLLYMLFELVKNGEFVSEFASEKLCYFLQRFGAKDYFKLEYQSNFYGPYSGKVKHILNYLNGSYITGYAGKDKKPFEELSLLIDSEDQVKEFIENNAELKKIVETTSSFLNGFYSSFGLELMSTVDFIGHSHNTSDKEFIHAQLTNWSYRKKALFSDDKFIDISISQLKNAQLLQ